MFTPILHSRQKGDIGEDIACKFITKKGFFVVERNYLKKWGEIDIVASKKGRVHFFEVKSTQSVSVTHRPEENVHVFKQKRLKRVIQTYLSEKGHGLGAEFFFHVLVVKMNMKTRQAHVSMIENVIL